MKRTLIIIASIVVLGGIAVAVYFFYFAGGPHLTTSPTPSFGDTGSLTTTSATPTGVPQAAGTLVAPRLVKITDGPVALGFAAFYLPAVLPSDASSTVALGSSTPAMIQTPGTPADVEIRYIDRASGNIYAYRAHARTSTRLSNKTLPGIQEASWLGDGSEAFVRFLASDAGIDHIDTYALPADGNGGYFLEQDLEQAQVDASSTLFSLLTNTNGSIGTIANPDGTTARTLFSSPLSSILVQFAGANFVATTKASANLDGYAFSVDRKSGTLTRILGAFRGLTTLPSPSGKFVLYSYVDQGTLHMQVLNVAAHTAIPLPLATLSEKCVWASDELSLYCAIPTSYPGTLPDDWYQGAISFTDRIWKIDLSARIASLVLDPSVTGKVSVDAVGLTLDSSGTELVFMNKKDGSLWVYGL